MKGKGKERKVWGKKKGKGKGSMGRGAPKRQQLGHVTLASSLPCRRRPWVPFGLSFLQALSQHRYQTTHGAGHATHSTPLHARQV